MSANNVSVDGNGGASKTSHADVCQQGNASNQDDSARGNEDNTNADPKTGIGFLKGWIRDGHRMHTILWACNVVWPVVWICFAARCRPGSYCFFIDSKGMVIFFWMFFFIPFLVEFFFSSTHKYLRNLNTTESLIDYMNRLYSTAPTLSMTIECFHMETRQYTYRDSNGNTEIRTETYPVVTYEATETVNIIAWEDESQRLQHSDISKYQVTKVTIAKTFLGDADYEAQRSALVANNRHHDVSYNLRVCYNIVGYTDKMLSYVDLDEVPLFLNLFWCWVAHITIFLALPYRVWMSSVTGKIDTNVHKKLHTRWLRKSEPA